jgi:RimJ/RimL family protein N-acetyltransferase
VSLSYHRLTSSDIDRFHALCTDEHVRRYLMDGQVLPREWAAAEIRASSDLFEVERVGLWLVRDDDEVVGFCGFRVFETMGPEPQLLYAFTERHTSKGLATAACRWMLELTRELGWTRVTAAVDAPNRASIRVLEKCGFARSGVVPGELGHTFLFERWETPPTRIAADVGRCFALEIASTWNGAPLEGNAITHLTLDLKPDELQVSVDAPFHGDPAPPADVGSTPQLWHHEVVELMLLGASDRYLEIELSPHGHYLVLALAGRRNVVHDGYRIYFAPRIDGARWTGTARIPVAWIPTACDRLNAFAMHGTGARRRHHAWKPRRDAGPTDRPDFHHLASFGSFSDTARAILRRA